MALVFAQNPAIAETAAAKRARHSQPTHATPVPPDTTGAIAKPQTQPPPTISLQASAPPDGEIPAPFYLPNVPRPRMHACGEIWRAKKMAGTTGDDDWRDFAIKCLASQDASVARNR